jgi:energy-coupling factor transport system substrate-specific component
MDEEYVTMFKKTSNTGKWMVHFGNFTTRDLAFIGMIVALMFIIEMVIMLGVAAITPFPGAKSIGQAFFISIIIAVGLAKVTKVGTFTIIGIIMGVVAGLIMPAFLPLLPAAILGGLAADTVTKIFYGRYGSRNSLVVACGVNQMVETLLILTIMVVFGFSTEIINPIMILITAILATVLGAAGGLIGSKIATELQSAGAIGN